MMNFRLTELTVRQLCGERSYNRGHIYLRKGLVKLTGGDAGASRYEGTAGDNGRDRAYHIAVAIGSGGEVDAGCTCAAFGAGDGYCGHIAAVLLLASRRQRQLGGDADPDAQRRDGEARLPEADGRPDLGRQSEADLATPHDRPGRERQSEADLATPHDRPDRERNAEEGHPGGLVPDESPDGGSCLTPEERRLAGGVLELFAAAPLQPSGARTFFDARTPLSVEFLCAPFPSANGKTLGLSLKIGIERMVAVDDVGLFLESVARSEACSVSGRFAYDPQLHCFGREDDAALGQLIRLALDERGRRDPAQSRKSGGRKPKAGGSRVLAIPPYAWETLAPHLMAAPAAKLDAGAAGHPPRLRISEEPLPLRFEFKLSESEGCVLDVAGLDSVDALPGYGMAVCDGMLVRLTFDQAERLQRLQLLVGDSGGSHIRIAPGQLEAFMEKAVPGLKKLGDVRIDDSLSERLVQTPLKAALYLDRVKDRLLAALEFRYGDIVINPLEGEGARGHDRIVMRDGEREADILGLMERSDFTRTESGYFMTGEEAEFRFLHEVVPQLEKLADIYATSAVKARLYVGPVMPVVRANADERTDWLEFSFAMEGIAESEIRKVVEALEEKRRYYRLPDGALLPLEGEEFQRLLRFMNETGLTAADLRGKGLRLPLARGLYLLEAGTGAGLVRQGRALRGLLESMRDPEPADFPLPAALAPVLRDYQKTGYRWMRMLASRRFGGVLADEMGLGKTVQSIAFLVALLPEMREQRQPALIVAPASLTYNWLNELRRFAPDIRAAVADGDERGRSRLAAQPAEETDVLITSYPLLRNDIAIYAGQQFHTLILDEAQTFKNEATQTAQAVRQLSAVHRFALTGTPVENRVDELWSIFSVVFPGLLPDRRSFSRLPREAAARRVKPFMLRRLKSDVLAELPDKIESVHAAELLPEQKKLYAAYLARLRQETLKHLDDDSFGRSRLRILAGLTRLRQLCCHPALFVEGYAGGSAKFNQLMELIGDCRNAGRRVLVFSQFTGMLKLIGRELGYMGAGFFYLDGQTPAAERTKLCDRFNAGERELFLISLKAGGTGLNLTGADTVILYDLWWNPAVENQAADRAHRIGQKKVVQVIRLIARGTVEEKMAKLQQAKIRLIGEVLGEGQTGAAMPSLTEEDIRDMLSLDTR